MPFTETTLNDIHNAALRAFATTPTCAISEDMFHEVTPELPFTETEIIQAVRYLATQKIIATGIRMSKSGVSRLVLLMGQSDHDLQSMLAEMRQGIGETGSIEVINAN